MNRNLALMAQRRLQFLTLKLPELPYDRIETAHRQLQGITTSVRRACSWPHLRAQAAQLILAVFPIYENFGLVAQLKSVLLSLYDQYTADYDDRLIARILYRLAQIFRLENRMGKAEEFEQYAERIALRLEDEELMAQVWFQKGERLFAQGETAASSAVAREAADLHAGDVDDPVGAAAVQNLLGRLSYHHGRPDEAIDHYQQAAAGWASLNRFIEQARVLKNLAMAYQATEQPDAAEETYRRALAIVPAAYPFLISDIRNCLGAFYVSRGEYGRAEETFIAADTAALTASNQLRLRAQVKQNLGYARLLADRFTAAQTPLRVSADLWRQWGSEVGRGEALGLLGEAHLRVGEYKQAIVIYDEAIPLLEGHDAAAVADLREERAQAVNGLSGDE